MKFLYFCLCLFLFTRCQNREKASLDSLQQHFINTIFQSQVEEGPFQLNYNLETVFFSDALVSLFGTFDEYTNLPHNHGFYEGKTFYKHGKWRQIFLDDLFKTKKQKEFLRDYCERDLKAKSSYFTGPLKFEDIKTFVINHKFLIIVLQPYIACSYADGPFIIKIPYEDLKNVWNHSHPLICLLEKMLTSMPFISSWDEEDFQESAALLEQRSNLSMVQSPERKL